MSGLKKILIIIIILTCIVSLIIVGYIFIKDYLECNSNNKDIDNLIDEVFIEDSSEEENKIDWNYLKSINEDIIGWIEIENTEINYPILKDNDNLYYLKHNYLKKYNSNGSIFTLDKQPFVLVNEGTKKGSSEAREGDSINISYPNNMKKRGRVGKGVSQTILTSPNMAVVENANKPICLNANKKVSIQDRIYDEEGISATVTASEFRPKVAERKMFNLYNDKEIKDIAPTQTTNCGSSTSSAAVLISENGSNYLKIRKLTPLECWRLMGFDDEDFYKAKNVGISDTQLYRQAGNSIVVNVLEEIFKTLLNLKLKNE